MRSGRGLNLTSTPLGYVADLAADQLERFAVLRLYDPVGLIAAGVEVVPTFRSPLVTLAFGDIDLGLATLESDGRLRDAMGLHRCGSRPRPHRCRSTRPRRFRRRESCHCRRGHRRRHRPRATAAGAGLSPSTPPGRPSRFVEGSESRRVIGASNGVSHRRRSRVDRRRRTAHSSASAPGGSRKC